MSDCPDDQWHNYATEEEFMEWLETPNRTGPQPMNETTNADAIQDLVGKTIASIAQEENPFRDWTDPDGVTITFTDGTVITFTANDNQGVGYLVILENERVRDWKEHAEQLEAKTEEAYSLIINTPPDRWTQTTILRLACILATPEPENDDE